MKTTLISIAAVVALAACNPVNDLENEPVPMDQDLDRGERVTPNMDPRPDMNPNVNPDNRTLTPDGAARPGLETENPAFDQSQDADDIQITAEIRRTIIGAEGMSTLADNVQIVTREGVVRLSGAVDSMDEKQEIERIATSVTGVSTVDNQIVVNQQLD